MDPNFPPNLDIAPLPSLGGQFESENQHEAITQYGIAGRVWEASRPLIRYFSPTQQVGLDPPCPVFTHDGPRRILELGSGQAQASLHLASFLSPADLLILTDLPNVMSLCERSILTWRHKYAERTEIIARPLPWGLPVDSVERYKPFTHIVMCDLIYFPHLYPPLLYTLLALTEPQQPTERVSETFGPTIVLSCMFTPFTHGTDLQDHSRSLSLEESFFTAFNQYFQMTPVTGGEWEAKVYICRRWGTTEEWQLPSVDKVMNGSRGVIRGRDFGLEDELLAGLQW